MKRKILSVILTISMTVALLVGCSGEAQEGDTTEMCIRDSLLYGVVDPRIRRGAARE